MRELSSWILPCLNIEPWGIWERRQNLMRNGYLVVHQNDLEGEGDSSDIS